MHYWRSPRYLESHDFLPRNISVACAAGICDCNFSWLSFSKDERNQERVLRRNSIPSLQSKYYMIGILPFVTMIKKIYKNSKYLVYYSQLVTRAVRVLKCVFRLRLQLIRGATVPNATLSQNVRCCWAIKSLDTNFLLFFWHMTSGIGSSTHLKSWSKKSKLIWKFY
mgnify:CR=1 FL=1